MMQPSQQMGSLGQQAPNSLLSQGSLGMHQQPIRPVPPLNLANQMQNMNLGSPITPTGAPIKPVQGFQNTPPMQPYVNGALSQSTTPAQQFGPPRMPMMPGQGPMPMGLQQFGGRPTPPPGGANFPQAGTPGSAGPTGALPVRPPGQSPSLGTPTSGTFPGAPQQPLQLQRPPFGQVPPGPRALTQPPSGSPVYPPGIRPMAPPTADGTPVQSPIGQLPPRPSLGDGAQSPQMPPQVGGVRATPPPAAGGFPQRFPMQPGQFPGAPQQGAQYPGTPPQPGMAPQQAGQYPGVPPQPVSQFPQMGMAPQQAGQYPRPGMYQQQQGQFPPAAPGAPQLQQSGQGAPGQFPPGAPGGYPAPSGYPSAPMGYQQQQQQRRLDPDQMPNPMDVWNDDAQKYEGQHFETNTKGIVPPLAVTDFITADRGNCGPRFVRSTMYNVPNSPDLIKQTQIPLGLVISPIAKIANGEQPPPVMDFGHIGPPRCNRCKAYMCPFMQFMDGGRRFSCPFCKSSTEVPAEYFNHLGHNGQRVDKYERPELCLGSYEFVVPKEYCRDNKLPSPPAYVFLIEVSYSSFKSGLVPLLCANIRYLLESLPKESEKSAMRVGFITYSNEIHFWTLANKQPSMMVVADINETFMPLVDGFLVDVEAAGEIINSLMESIPTIFAETKETEAALGPAIQGGLEALKAAKTTGKLLVFQSTLPSSAVPGALKPRDDRKLLGTEKEKTVLAPQTTYYNELGQSCSGAGVSVDMFLTNPTFIDVATLCQVSRLTGGTVFKYTYFQAGNDGHRLLEDCRRSIANTLAFDAVLRVRTSTGIRPVDFYGSYFMANTQDVELAAMDTSKAITVEVKHEDKIPDEEAYFQVAFLFTSVSGQRRVRIHNLSLPTCSMINDVYKAIDVDAVMNLFSKQAVSKILDATPKPLKDSLIGRVCNILATYRKHSGSPSSMGQLILPELLKLLPLYTNCLIKSDALSGGADLLVDDRALFMHVTQTMDVKTSLNYLYPRLLAIHEMNPEDDTNPRDFPNAIRCSHERLKQEGAYILENGFYIFVWIGTAVSPVWLKNVLGVNSFTEIRFDQLIEFPVLSNPTSEWIRGVMSQIAEERPRSMKVTFVKPHDRMESLMRRFLVEDRQEQFGGSSYVDFLCHVHKEIRSILN